MSELNQMGPAKIEPIVDPPVRRSKWRLAMNILTQLFLIAILAVIVFVMWLPAIVSKK